MGELWRFFALNFLFFSFYLPSHFSVCVRARRHNAPCIVRRVRSRFQTLVGEVVRSAALSVCAAVELVRLLGLALCTRSQLQLAARSARTAACRKPTVTTRRGAKRRPTACDVAHTGCRRRIFGSPDAAQNTKSGGDPEIPAGKRGCRSHPSMKFERWRS